MEYSGVGDELLKAFVDANAYRSMLIIKSATTLVQLSNLYLKIGRTQYGKSFVFWKRIE